MNPMSFHRLRGNLKGLFAALGVGVLATMGALTSIFHAAGSVRTEPVLAGLWG